MGENEVLYLDNPLNIQFRAWIKQKEMGRVINFSLVIYNNEEVPIFNVSTIAKCISEEVVEAVCHIPANFMNDDHFSVRILIVEDSSHALCDLSSVITFKLQERIRDSNWHGKWIGAVRPTEYIKWTY